MESNIFKELPHRRWNPLIEEWILVSPHRTKRPWMGKQEDNKNSKLPRYDPGCYLCPANLRANGVKNPDYNSTFVFDNDFSALVENKNYIKTQIEENYVNGLVKQKTETGECRVVCFSPRHDLTLPNMEKKDVINVINIWIQQYIEIGNKKDISYIQIFENKGEIMGCSNPHPHCQIWSQKSIPTIPLKEIKSQRKYYNKHKNPLLLDYLKWEIKQKERLVYKNVDWAVIVPHWAVWPYETLLIPKNKLSKISDLNNRQIEKWADAILCITRKYDKLFNISFPYSMGIHQSPVDGKDYSYTILHQHFLPPLLRSATIKKFMVGYEMAGEPQRDILPESAAEILRNLKA